VSILDRARGGQNQLEQIANAIPGFKGYRERELRRDADRLQREFIAERLETCKKQLDAAASSATRSGSLDVINDIETARKRLDRLVARIRYADRGYAGFFDAVKVEEETLGRVYEFDLAMVAEASALQDAARALGGEPDALKTGLGAFIQKIDALDARLADREAVLRGFA